MEWFLELIKNNPDQINAFVALCALFISLLSIILTVFALRMQQRHNYKSLTPIASLPIGDYENLIEVSLKNTGVGPLIVKSFVVSNGSENKNNIIDWMPKTPENIDWETFYNDIEGLCVPPNESAIIIRLSGNENSQTFSKFRDQVRKALAPLKIKVAYQDIYERDMPVRKRDLSWFGRHERSNTKIVKSRQKDVIGYKKG
jgi:hypothetical protein